MHGKKFRKSSTFSIFFTQEDRSDKNVTSISVSHTNEVFINKQLSDDSVSKPTDVNIYKSPIQDVKTKEEEEEKEDEDSTKWQEQYSRYAKNPIINQDVLKYGFEKVKNETNFRCWDLTEWLIENNPVLRDESKKDKQQRPSTRIKNRLKPVKHMLDNLEELGIITSRNVRAKKGKYDTKEYKFTYAGYLIILLFEKYNGNTEAINKKIYQLLQDSYNKLRTSYSKFWAIYIRKCLDKGYFESYLNHHIEYLKNNRNSLQNTSHFLHGVSYTLPLEKAIFWSLWLESLDELNDGDRDLFLYHQKLQIEDLYLRRVKAFASYEKERFDIKNYPELVALEGYCKICKKYFPARAATVGYLEKELKSGIFTSTCNLCKGIIDFDTIQSLFMP